MMPFLSDATAIQLGNKHVDAIYLGEQMVWEDIWTPMSVAGLTIWWDAADLTDISTVWPDKSGSGKDGTVVGTPVPVILPNMLNGRQIVRFTIGQGRIRQNATGVDKNYTLIVVNRKWQMGTAGRCITTASPGTNLILGYHINPPPDGVMDTFSEFPAAGTTRTANTDWVMYSVDSTNTPANMGRLFINGVFKSQVATNTGLGGVLYISGYSAAASTESMSCGVAEVLLYNRKLTDLERQTVEGYLKNKWAV